MPGREAAEGARLSAGGVPQHPKKRPGVQPGEATGRPPVWLRARQVAVVHLKLVAIG